MYRRPIGMHFLVLMGVVCLATIPGNAIAQYNCAVAIELKGKEILKGQIRDVERPATDQLWELLESLSFSPAKDAQDLPDPKTVEKTTLKGELRVKINGAGNVELKELSLVRNKFDTAAWVIAPDEVTRILKMRKTSGETSPNK